MSCVSNPQQKSFQAPEHEKRNAEHEYSVLTYDNLLTTDEMQYLLSFPTTFEKSMVLMDNGSEVLNAGRTSSTAFIPKSADRVVECIERKLSHTADQPHAFMEGLQLTRYDPSQKYDPHHDAFHESGNGQRTTTIFTHLKGVDRKGCGGATVFPKCQDASNPGGELRVESRSGVSVQFDNLDDAGQVHPMSLHGGENLSCANIQKIGLNAWWQDRPI